MADVCFHLEARSSKELIQASHWPEQVRVNSLEAPLPKCPLYETTLAKVLPLGATPSIAGVLQLMED